MCESSNKDDSSKNAAHICGRALLLLLRQILGRHRPACRGFRPVAPLLLLLLLLL